MANPNQFIIDPYPMCEPGDARYLGAMYEIGMALPNDRLLTRKAALVTDFSDASYMARRDRMLGISGTLAELTLFGGLADVQLRLQDDETSAYNLVIVPNVFTPADSDKLVVPDLKLKTEGGILDFKLVANIEYEAETRPDPATGTVYQDSKEGCFSGFLTSTFKKRPRRLRWVRARDPLTGELLVAQDVTGLAARSIPHEGNHNDGKRPPDGQPGRFRAVISHDPDSPRYVGNYRKLRTLRAAFSWRWRQSQDGWRDVSRNLRYDYTPNDELRAAYQAGRDEQRARKIARA